MLGSNIIQLEVFAEIYNEDNSLVERRHIPQECIDPTIQINSLDEKGNIINSIEFPMKSFVYNFALLWYRNVINNTSYGSLVKTTGVADSSSWYTFPLLASTNHNKGIIVGTSNAAVTTTDYNAADLISHGTGAGQLQFGSVTFTDTVTAGGVSKCIVHRIFTNGSGGNIVVREVGSVCYSGTNYVMLNRDIEDSVSNPIEITIANGTAMQVKYNYYCTTASGLNKNFILLAEREFRAASALFKFVSGSSSTISTFWFLRMRLDASWGDDTFGIVVGTNNSALDLAGYKLGSKISHGFSSGQLLYGGFEKSVLNDSGTDLTFDIKRNFTNSSGGTIVLEEAGAYGYGMGSSESLSLMWARVLLGGLTLLNTQSAKIIFRFKMSL